MNTEPTGCVALDDVETWRGWRIRKYTYTNGEPLYDAEAVEGRPYIGLTTQRSSVNGVKNELLIEHHHTLTKEDS